MTTAWPAPAIGAYLTRLHQGQYLCLRGEHGAGRAEMEAALTLARQADDRWSECDSLRSLGVSEWRAWGTYPVRHQRLGRRRRGRAVRGAEEKQLVDSWLATRVSRPRLVASRPSGPPRWRRWSSPPWSPCSAWREPNR